MNADEVSGRVVIVPAMNYPAFNAGKRPSWIDGSNMNRVFPGNPGGHHYRDHRRLFLPTLLPMADYVIDIHSGGKTMEFCRLGLHIFLMKKISRRDVWLLFRPSVRRIP